MTMPKIEGYTAEDLEHLTPEELSALESDAGVDEEEIRELANSGDEGDAAATAEAKAAAEAAKPKLDKDGKEIPGEAATTTTEEAETPVKVKAFVAEAPADAEAQITAAKEAKSAAKKEDADALKKLHDGEIDFEEYSAVKAKADDAIEAANETISTVKEKVNNAKIADGMAQQDTAASWANEVQGLFKVGKAEGFDYKGNADLQKELNGLVKGFGLEATERGLDDDKNLEASKWALQQAHATMKARHPDLVKAPAKETEAEKTARETKEKAEKAGKNRHDLTTLGNMPNADRALGDNDQMVKLGTLEGDELEKAMALMSPADIEKMLAST